MPIDRTTNQFSTATNRYGAIAAEIYDIDKPFGALPDTAFHLERLAGFSGRILEPACGSGRTLVPLLEAGLDVTGFDPSPDMLSRCRARCADRGFDPDLSDQRFETFHYEHPFEAIIVPVGTFTLIDTFEAAMAALHRFAEHLTPGGLLVIDNALLASMGGRGEDRRHWTAENGDYLTLEGVRWRTDWLGQRVEYAIRYERWRDNRLVETELEPMAQRYWGLEEFRFALQAAGFGDIRTCARYDRGRTPRGSDSSVTFEAVKL